MSAESSSGPNSSVLFLSLVSKTCLFGFMFPTGGLVACSKKGTLVPRLLYISTLSNLKEGCFKVIRDLPSVN